MDNAKYNTTNNKLIPHARCTDPRGSGEHEENNFVSTPFFFIMTEELLSMSSSPVVPFGAAVP
eukprot:CAMPEP_0170864938 /NCGR_PEP_ID=MMETSP0734-20130129/20895_1 /TAXON_ID=186038 /ORGANISM="Fragilariopsis kerguelensis, Strain L26-C5" /LENGTH=62 /DNA_ID=CAMNT_0011240881 /DNA_START=42 /DNA_END=227 /DNA_ORIENTATION=-